MSIADNAEFFEILKALIDAWCDRRALRPLARILPAYTAFYGMTDGWAELLEALKNVRAYCRDELPETEMAAIAELVRAAEKAVYR
jgi:hypothetical protein